MKRLVTLLLVVILLLTCVLSNAEENERLTVWAVESSMISDYSTNGQSAWMEEQTGIQIDWVSTPKNGWYQAFQASVMNGDDIDIYLYEFDTSEATMLGCDMNYLLPLEDYITPEITPNICAILEANPEIRELITAPDGHIYTLFTHGAYDTAAYKNKMWVNRFFFDKYQQETGNGLPQTTKEFEAMLIYFKENDMNGDGELNEIPFIGNNGTDGMYNLFGAFLPVNSGNGFGTVFDNEGKLQFCFNQEAYREGLSYARGLYEQGLISPDSFTISSEERYVYTSGSKTQVRAGVVIAPTVEQVVQLGNEEDAMTYADYIPLAPLEGPNGVRTVVTAGETILSLRNGVTIHCENPIHAMKWLDAGYSEDARMYAVYGGVENVDWCFVEGTTLGGDGKAIEAMHEIGDNSTWSGQGIVYCITEDDYLRMDLKQLPTNGALVSYQSNLAYRPYAIQSPWRAIVWPGAYADSAAEYSDIRGLIAPAVTSYYTDVITGKKNLEGDWDAYVEELDNMGLARYIELTELYVAIGEK